MDLVETDGATLQDRVFSPICCHLLKICYFIAIIDLSQSFYFLVQSLFLLTHNVDLYSLIAFLGSVFWIFMVGLLLLGLWKGRLPFVVSWLCFSLVGVILDILFFVWTISISQEIKWRQIIQFTFLYFGIVFEWLCVYIVYKYCLKIKSPPAINEPEDGNVEPRRSSELKAIDQPKKVKSMSSKFKFTDQSRKGKSRGSTKMKSTMNSEQNRKLSKSEGQAIDSNKSSKRDSNHSKEESHGPDSKQKLDQENKKKKNTK